MTMNIKKAFSLVRFAVILLSLVGLSLYFATHGSLTLALIFLLAYGAFYTYGKVKGYIPL